MNFFLSMLSAASAAEFQNSKNYKGADPDMKIPTSVNLEYGLKTDLNEPRRPKIHLSPYMMWMNDPNGLVKDPKGNYHVFYQHHPNSLTWDPMHWAHATSKDLINWDHLPIALRPPHGNEHTRMKFSGSAVIDTDNSAGFGKDAMVLIATDSTFDWVKSASQDRKYEIQEQSISYSSDYIHFTDYESNPVLPNPWMDAGRMATTNKNGNNAFPLIEGPADLQSIADQSGFDAFRDPNVVKVEDTWVMALSQNNHVEFWYSCDLKDWKLLQSYDATTNKTDYGFGFHHESSSTCSNDECKPIENKYLNSGRPSLGGAGGIGNHSGVFECPDLVAFPDPKDPSKELYYLGISINPGGPNEGSITQYLVGEFDFTVDGTCTAAGKGFVPGPTFDGQANCDLYRHSYVDYGPDNYAGVTFHTSDKTEKTWMGWMSNWEYANVVPYDSWGRNQMTWPRTMKLHATCAVDNSCPASTKDQADDNFKFTQYIMTQKPFSAESLYCSTTPFESSNNSSTTVQALPTTGTCAGTQGVMEMEGTFDYETGNHLIESGDRLGIRLMTSDTDLEGSVVFGYQNGILGQNAKKVYNNDDRSKYYTADLKCPVADADWDARYGTTEFFFVDRSNASRKVDTARFGGDMALTHAKRHWENNGKSKFNFKAIVDVNSLELFWDSDVLNVDDGFFTSMQTVTFFNETPFTHFRLERQRDTATGPTIDLMKPSDFKMSLKIHPLKNARFSDSTGYNIDNTSSSIKTISVFGGIFALVSMMLV